MNKPKTILLTTDFSATSRKAIEPAAMLARTYGAKILLVHVGDLIPIAALEQQPIDVQAVERRQRESAAAELSRFGAEHLPPELDVERIVTLGVPHAEILRLAAERRADLIAMAMHGRGFLSHLVLGSTTERVLRGAPCPVLVVRRISRSAPPRGRGPRRPSPDAGVCRSSSCTSRTICRRTRSSSACARRPGASPSAAASRSSRAWRAAPWKTR
jgi:nucleotide-binding universal stress UspA family protein